jgi:hypothetical protein
MPVKPDSRYAKSPVYDTTAPDGSQRRALGVLWRRYEQVPDSVPYQLRRSDDIDLLARRNLNNERLWWKILDANPLVYPFDLEPGDVLNIPTTRGNEPTTRARRF